jgi:hypothetical protein
MLRIARDRRRAACIGAVSALVAAGALPSAAGATSHAYNGPAGTGANAGVEFGAHIRKGRARSVHRFEFHNIPAQCQPSGTTAVTDPLGVTMKVNKHRHFGRTVSLNGGKLTVVVSGKFSRDLSEANGTLRARGTVPGCATADTGVVHWHAPQIS